VIWQARKGQVNSGDPANRAWWNGCDTRSSQPVKPHLRDRLATRARNRSSAESVKEELRLYRLARFSMAASLQNRRCAAFSVEAIGGATLVENNGGIALD